MKLKEMQEIQLNILKSVINFCNENNLKYFALGGTALGAERHEGVIPWDDDIDIGMPRDDYEFFCSNIEKYTEKNLKLRNYKTDSSYRYYISRLMDTNHKIIETRNEQVENYTYISIDIFPLDGFPENDLFRKIHISRILYRRALMSLSYFETIDTHRKRGIGERLIIMFFSKFPFWKFINANSQKQKIDKLLNKYSYQDNAYIGNIMGAYRNREITPKDWFEPGVMKVFDSIKINCPYNQDRYLTQLYGDYMKVPSEEEIIGKKHFIGYINEEELNND